MPTIGGRAATGVLNVRDFGARADGVYNTTGTLTTSSAVLSDPNAAFTAADVGKVLCVNGDVRTIASVQSATQLTMSASSSYGAAGNTPYIYGTDDTAAFTATLAALPKGGGTVLVPGLMLDGQSRLFTTKVGLQLKGIGGRVGVNNSKGAGLTGGGVATPNSGLVYTGTASYYLKWQDCLNIGLQDMAVLYGSVGFTGDLLSFQGTNGITPGMFFGIRDCLLTGAGTSGNWLANCLVNLSGAVFCDLEDVVYGMAKYHVIGLDPAAASKGATNLFSNAVTFRGGSTEFAEATVACVLNPGESWQFFGTTFEPIKGAKAGAVICSPSTKNLLFSGVGFWDAINVGGTWVKLAGVGITFRDCFLNDGGAGDFYFDASTANVDGLIIEGCHFDNYNNSVNSILKLPTSGGAVTLSGLWYKANVYTRGAVAPVLTGNANVIQAV